jgi:hypothetical protein
MVKRKPGFTEATIWREFVQLRDGVLSRMAEMRLAGQELLRELRVSDQSWSVSIRSSIGKEARKE